MREETGTLITQRTFALCVEATHPLTGWTRPEQYKRSLRIISGPGLDLILLDVSNI
jgi:hypothetical protein